MFSDVWSFGTVSGLVTFALGCLLTWYLQSRILLRYDAEEVTLVGGNQPEFRNDVEVFYRGSKVARLTKSTVTIWNGGNRAIEPKDIAPKNPLRVVVKGTVLQARIAAASKADNAPAISGMSQSDGRVDLSFDFLQPRDGIAIEILHDGPSGSIEVLGQAIHSKEGVRRGARQSTLQTVFDEALPWNRRLAVAALNVVAFFSTFWMLMMGVSIGFAAGLKYATGTVGNFAPLPENMANSYPRVFYGILAAYGVIWCAVLWMGYRQAPNLNAPTGGDLEPGSA